MNNLKVAIIEDEVPAARLLHSMLKRLRPQWEIVVLPGNIEEAVAWFDANPHPELLFLDIHLSDGNSFDFLSPVPSFIDRYFYDGLRSVCYPGFQCQQYRLSAQTDRRKTLTGSDPKI